MAYNWVTEISSYHHIHEPTISVKQCSSGLDSVRFGLGLKFLVDGPQSDPLQLAALSSLLSPSPGVEGRCCSDCGFEDFPFLDWWHTNLVAVISILYRPGLPWAALRRRHIEAYFARFYSMPYNSAGLFVRFVYAMRSALLTVRAFWSTIARKTLHVF